MRRDSTLYRPQIDLVKKASVEVSANSATLLNTVVVMDTLGRQHL